MCRRSVQSKCEEIVFEDVQSIYEVHPSCWVQTDSVIENKICAIKRGMQQSGLAVYTDASMSFYSAEWSYIAYHHGFSVSSRHGALTKCTAFKAEAYAVLQPLRYVSDLDDVHEKKVVEIRTDCQALVKVLQRYANTNWVIRAIEEQLRAAERKNKRIQILWVPSHSGVIENERANALARVAVDSHYVTKMVKTNREIPKIIREKQEEEMKVAWTELESRHIRVFLPNLADVRNFAKASPSAALCQIVAGHSRLNDFIYKKWGLIKSSLCECQEADETISHFLFQCRLHHRGHLG